MTEHNARRGRTWTGRVCGGECGARGVNTLRYAADQRVVTLGGKNTVVVARGDRLTILTPGGGGYGANISTTASASDEHSSSGNSRGTDEGGKMTFSRSSMTTGSLHNYTMNQESV